MRVLIPIDGSQGSLAALDRLLERASWFRTPLEIHLLNVQRALPQDIGRFISAENLQQLHHERGMACLESARERIANQGVTCNRHVVVGDAAETIVRFARQQQCEMIAIGTRGLGSLPGLLLGSVTTRVLHLADIPVLALK
jgi:nucleotide-binding universal stress UspA family protein